MRSRATRSSARTDRSRCRGARSSSYILGRRRRRRTLYRRVRTKTHPPHDRTYLRVYASRCGAPARDPTDLRAFVSSNVFWYLTIIVIVIISCRCPADVYNTHLSIDNRVKNYDIQPLWTAIRVLRCRVRGAPCRFRVCILLLCI